MKTKLELEEELCEYCPLRDYVDELPPPPTPSNPMGCEGIYCDDAYKNYKRRLTVYKKGMKVTYKTKFKSEKEILKSLSGNEHAFVVYNCGGDWDNYENYTGARTRLCDLEKGW